MSLEEFGSIEYSITLAFFLVNLCILGQDSAVVRFFYEFKKNHWRRQLISQSLIFQVLCLIVLLPSLWLFLGNYSLFPSEFSEVSFVLLLVFLRVPFLVLFEFAVNITRCTLDKARFTVLTVGLPCSQAVSLLVLFVEFESTVLRVLIVLISIDLFFACVSFRYIFPWLLIPKGFAFLRRLLPYALPLGASGGLISFSPVLERTLIISSAGTYAMSEFAVASKFALLITAFATAFYNAWGPISLKIRYAPDSTATYNLVLKLFVFFVCIASLGLSFIAETVLVAFEVKAHENIRVLVFPLALAAGIHGTSWIHELGLSLSKRTELILLSYSFGIITTFIGILALIPVFGVWGAGVSVLLGSITKATMVFYLSQKVNFIDWRMLYVVLSFIFTALLGFGFDFLLFHSFGNFSHFFLGFGVIILCIFCFRGLAS